MKWKIDPDHTVIQFSVRYFGISVVRGIFRKFSGVVDDASGGTPAKVTVEIDAASIDTNQPERDTSLRGEYFLDAVQHPLILFQGTQNGSTRFDGELTMKDKTAPMSFEIVALSEPMKDPHGQTRRGAALSGRIGRESWGVSGNMNLPNGLPAIENQVTVTIDGEAIAQG